MKLQCMGVPVVLGLLQAKACWALAGWRRRRVWASFHLPVGVVVETCIPFTRPPNGLLADNPFTAQISTAH